MASGHSPGNTEGWSQGGESAKSWTAIPFSFLEENKLLVPSPEGRARLSFAVSERPGCLSKERRREMRCSYVTYP